MIVKRGIPKMETFYALNMFFSEIIVDFWEIYNEVCKHGENLKNFLYQDWGMG